MTIQLAALVFALAAASRPDDPPATAIHSPAPSAESAPAQAADPAPTAKPGQGRRAGMMAMKPLVCREVSGGKGKSGAELAAAIELMGAQMIHGGYHLAGIVQGDPPIACFANNTDPSKLPLGAR